MWKEFSKKNLEKLLSILNNIITKFDDLEKINSIQILDLAEKSNDQISKEIRIFVSKIFQTPEFLLDMNHTKPTSEILEAVQEWQRQILDHIEIQEHPDNLPELLYGQREFGCVYVPTQLLKHLHRLGETVLEYLNTKSEETGKKTEEQILKIIIEASKWVKYTKRKWGIMPTAELTVVSPLTEKQIENAEPDTETNPPF